jgi:class 3 adenylate cyclase
MDIGGWLRSLGLHRYEAAFRENEINEDVLPKLTQEDLKEIGVGPVGHRRTILASIAALCAGPDAEDSPLVPTSMVLRTARRPSEEAILKPPSEPKERRHVTLMFCDLVDATDFSAKFDAEEWRGLLASYLDAASTAVTEWGGEIVKRLDDRLIARFGYPVAQEDDAERAAHAAGVIWRSLAKLNRKDDRIGKTIVAARIAIDSRPMVISAAGEIFGDLPNVVTTPVQMTEALSSAMPKTRPRQIAGPLVAEARRGHELESATQMVRLNEIIPASDGDAISYHQVIARAVDGLDRNTGEARRALYDRARNALVAQLRSNKPVLVLADITQERLALEEAIRRVEVESARKVRTESRKGARELRSADLPTGTPEGRGQVASGPARRHHPNQPETALPGTGRPAVLFGGRDQLQSKRSSRTGQAATGLVEVSHEPRTAYEPHMSQDRSAEEAGLTSHEFQPDPDGLHSDDYDTGPHHGYEPAYEPEDAAVALPRRQVITASDEKQQTQLTRRQLSYQRSLSVPRPHWDRPLTRPLVVSGVMTLGTLNDVRVLIERHLPAESRAKEMWMYVSNELRQAALGHSIAEFSSLLEMSLSLEGLEWVLK